jgi:hypothetical protein
MTVGADIQVDLSRIVAGITNDIGIIIVEYVKCFGIRPIVSCLYIVSYVNGFRFIDAGNFIMWLIVDFEKWPEAGVAVVSTKEGNSLTGHVGFFHPKQYTEIAVFVALPFLNKTCDSEG